ncbi:anti-sigma factor [Actinomyces bowdenii]|uniref:Anti-sigma factor n=1 Tax=Actinomyces bowdenii TaxID=131109 RepID=A0A3P1V7N8_9ACTO|nr:anti-sigma factor [Actinomyces bowdenii]RRD29520.1 anti-sigma factor [Actinomyces bowdenii]
MTDHHRSGAGAPGRQDPGLRTGPQEAEALAGAEGIEGGGTAEGFSDEAAAMLGASLRPVPPPEDLRARLLAAVGQEPVRPAARSAAARPGEPVGASPVPSQDGPRPAAEPPQAPGPQEGARVLPLGPRRRRAWIMRAAAVLVLISAGFGTGRWSAMESMETTEYYADLNQAQDVQRVTDTMPDGHVATLTWSQDKSMTALSLPSEMMEAAGQRSLQVWLRDGQELASLGVYDPDSGDGFFFLDIMPEPGQEIVITQEPAGGSDQPTSEPLVVLRVGTAGPQGT